MHWQVGSNGIPPQAARSGCPLTLLPGGPPSGGASPYDTGSRMGFIAPRPT